ncbi:MAG: hypothetical protein IPL46_17290 [Saprospiraceae bacterium]|nr:hypothetical protein [Saprospiraceae bacterium]
MFLYQPGFLHSKLIISDDSSASVGTANLDIRSFDQNFEINAFILDKDIAQQLTNEFLADLDKSDQVVLEQFRTRSFTKKILEGFSRILSPLL